MSVVKVTASVDDQLKEMTKARGMYTATLTAPEESGEHDVSVVAYDETGITTEVVTKLKVSLWKTPKTDWKSTDKFNFKDYNRIKNNIIYLQEFADELFKNFTKENLGEDITSYKSYYRASQFNAIEEALEQLNNNTVNQSIGTTQRFFDNGVFIRYDELNRIEEATLMIYELFVRRKNAIRKIPFVLGGFREVRI